MAKKVKSGQGAAISGSAKAEGTLATMRGVVESLNRAEQKVARHILANPENVLDATVTELARQAGVSEATVVRLARTIGRKGYQDLKIAIARELVSPVQRIGGAISESDDAETISRKIFAQNSQALDDTLKVLDFNALEASAELIAKARKVMFTGVGTSSPVVRDAYIKFSRLGIECFWETDSHLQIMAAALLSKGDVIVAISHSGSTIDPIETLKVARRAGAKAIVITSNVIAPITKNADHVLVTASGETRYRHEALASRIAQTSIVSALFMTVSMKNLKKTLRVTRRIEEAIVSKQI